MPDLSPRQPSPPKRPIWKKVLWFCLGSSVLLGLLMASGYWVVPAWIFSIMLEEHTQGKSLTLELGGEVTTYTFEISEYTVDLKVFTTASGDNGPATIEVSVDGQPTATLLSRFNYDLWSADHPARSQLRDVDGDRHPDLIIRLQTWEPESYYVSSADGKIYPHEVQYTYPRNW